MENLESRNGQTQSLRLVYLCYCSRVKVILSMFGVGQALMQKWQQHFSTDTSFALLVVKKPFHTKNFFNFTIVP